MQQTAISGAAVVPTNAVIPPYNPLWPTMQSGKFGTRLCDCCAVPGGCSRCAFSAFCSPCQFGDNSARLSRGEAPCAGDCCAAGCSFCLLGGTIPCITCTLFCVPVPLSLSFLMHMYTRRAIRKKYGIQGTLCRDCLATGFCVACSLCQESRELTIHGAGIVQGGIVTQPAPAYYQPGIQMMPTPAVAPGVPYGPPQVLQPTPYAPQPYQAYPQQQQSAGPQTFPQQPLPYPQQPYPQQPYSQQPYTQQPYPQEANPQQPYPQPLTPYAQQPSPQLMPSYQAQQPGLPAYPHFPQGPSQQAFDGKAEH